MEHTTSERQFDVLRLYGDLVSEREDWSGALVLACSDYAEIVPTAVSIANGTTLWLTADAGVAKSALRRGEVDFVVSTLDEAVRTLKNQIRKGSPLGVAVTANLTDVLSEIVERGVLPDWMLGGSAVLDGPTTRASIESLRQSGMVFLYGPYRGKDAEPWQKSMMVLHRHRHFAYRVHAESLPQLREIDAHLLAALPEADLPRRRWLQRVSRYLRDTPSGGRWVWLTEEEVQALPCTWKVSPESR